MLSDPVPVPVRISRRGTIRMGLFGGEEKKDKKEQ